MTPVKNSNGIDNVWRGIIVVICCGLFWQLWDLRTDFSSFRADTAVRLETITETRSQVVDNLKTLQDQAMTDQRTELKLDEIEKILNRIHPDNSATRNRKADGNS